MKRILSIVAFFAALSGAPAYAADLPSVKDTPAYKSIMPGLSGLYVMGLAGYGFTDTGDHCSGKNCTFLQGLTDKLSTASTGGSFTGRVGYDAAVLNSSTYGSWVLGAYGEGGYNDVYGGLGSVRERWNAGGGIRTGFRWGNSMPYLLAGYTMTSASLQGVDTKGQDLNGFKFGGGFETALGKNLSLVVEVTKSEYEPFRYSYNTGAGTHTNPTVAHSVKADPQDLGAKIGLAYHF